MVGGGVERGVCGKREWGEMGEKGIKGLVHAFGEISCHGSILISDC